MGINFSTLEIEDWILHTRYPEGDGPFPVALLVHGWTGDENSMWVFASRLPKDFLLIAPRGLHTAPRGGYGWHAHSEQSLPWVDEFRPSIEALMELLTPANFPKADFSRMYLIGFSQGAALVYTFALLYPGQVVSLAGLAGFLPQGAAALARNLPLRGKPVFVAHGTQDDQVPVERARQAVEILQQAGAEVTYCEDDVGHKLSATCFRALESFFSAQGTA